MGYIPVVYQPVISLTYYVLLATKRHGSSTDNISDLTRNPCYNIFTLPFCDNNKISCSEVYFRKGFYINIVESKHIFIAYVLLSKVCISRSSRMFMI